MSGVRQGDGRRGRVFSIRLSDADITEITAAVRAEHPWRGLPKIGPWIVAAAMRRAREVTKPAAAVLPARARTGSNAAIRAASVKRVRGGR